MAAFRLSKWYLDCVTDSGDTSILYTGAVRWGALRLNYSSVIESEGSSVSVRQSLRRANPPEHRGDAFRWRSEALGIEAGWKAQFAALRETIFTSELGNVEWHCVVPCGSACVGSRAGLGYVERLDMTVAPWSLPIRTLRWGRFLSAMDWIVWIQWVGEHPRSLCWWNGMPAPVHSFEDDCIHFADDSRLLLDRSLVLRDGPLGTVALGSIPGIRDSVPGRLLHIVERKWRSLARFERNGAPPVEGWSIHESVEWPL